MNRAHLRAIPSVDKILHELGDTGLPRPIVVDAVRRELAEIRKEQSALGLNDVLARMHNALSELRSSRIQPVINGTGILIHTNFGRAPLGPAVVEVLAKIASNYSNLEYGLTEGSRGERAAYLERGLALLCEAEAATVVNNNAAALVLILTHCCKKGAATQNHPPRNANQRADRPKNEVIVSRGELVQIGGGFRIPEILGSSGARLREVGTTNKTSLRDYARAITEETALILKVHRSNFYMEGFVESPSTEEIVDLARGKRIPFVEDLGSGALIETGSIAGLEHETTPAELVRRGVDLVCFSGDKLLGGPQAGIIAGKAKWIAALKREPLFRALRCDKLILSALEATADIYLRQGQIRSARNTQHLKKTLANGDHQGLAGIPVVKMLRASNEELLSRADKLLRELNGNATTAVIGTGKSEVGGGSLPRSELNSITLNLSHSGMKPQEMAARLRKHAIPVIGYVARGKLKLDLRTIFPSQDHEVIKAVLALSASRG
jgi:L-seryl-tRNA(Ser) seleniumtransferase